MSKDVLVAHSSIDARYFLADVLEGAGYDCRMAADLAAAKREIARKTPSVVLLSGRLASEAEDSLALVTRLSGEAFGVAVIVICVPWNGDVAKRALLRGAFAVIEQPWDPGDLLHAVRAAARQTERRSASMSPEDATSTAPTKFACTTDKRASPPIRETLQSIVSRLQGWLRPVPERMTNYRKESQ
ncbi:MAG TPA: hypothetical protein VEU47_00160 [Candidatus Cybelea sp.]|nr:hypothetical protein [Candidatus Cybelea sp.]